jgi:hypothetical protein
VGERNLDLFLSSSTSKDSRILPRTFLEPFFHHKDLLKKWKRGLKKGEGNREEGSGKGKRKGTPPAKPLKIFVEKMVSLRPLDSSFRGNIFTCK